MSLSNSRHDWKPSEIEAQVKGLRQAASFLRRGAKKSKKLIDAYDQSSYDSTGLDKKKARNIIEGYVVAAREIERKARSLEKK